MVPDLEQHWFDLYGKVALTGQSVRFTQGSAVMGRWFDVYAFRIGNVDSRKVALLFTDITERKKAEQALTEKDRHLRNIIHSAPMPMLVLKGQDMVVDMINERMLEMIGKDTSVIGKPLLEFMPELNGEPGYERFLQVYATGKADSGKEILVPLMRNGVMEQRYFNFAYTPVVENGMIVGVIDVATEVTEQVFARKQLEQSNDEFRFALDLMPQMVWVTNAEGYHHLFNKQWYVYTGLSEQETKGTGWSTVVHPEDLEPTLKIWHQSLRTGEPYQIQYRLKRYDGFYFWFLARALPLKDASGTILNWYGTCTDIDDQRKQAAILEEKVAERTQELITTNQELARSNQNLEEFAYAASHDLKEPVRKIQFFTQKLKDQLKTQLSEAEEKSFSRIKNAAERMGLLIDDLLLYSHVSQRPLEKEKVDLNQKIQRVLEDLELDIQEKGAIIHYENLPVLKGYRRQLQQLFQNLLSNAIKYSKAGEPPRINISGSLVSLEGKNYHQITIQDNGIGFEQEYAEKIFQMFTRLHATAEYKGTGVGLSIAKKVVQNHDGFINVESNPNEGSVFIVHLPAE